MVALNRYRSETVPTVRVFLEDLLDTPNYASCSPLTSLLILVDDAALLKTNHRIDQSHAANWLS
jgi:hypothetical protein